METRWTPASLARLTRLAGVLYLLIIAGGVVGELGIRQGLVVPGDAVATAAKIKAAESLWRLGVAIEYLMLACSVGVMVILYVLLRPVSREVTLLAVLFNLLTVAMEATNELNLQAALLPLAGAEYLKVFTPAQLAALAHLPLRLYPYGFGADLIFFGFTCLALGYLIFRSGYLPRTIGVLMALAGVAYLVNSFALILSPPLANRLFPLIMLPPLVGESALCLWLLFRGVDAARWQARAAASDPGSR